MLFSRRLLCSELKWKKQRKVAKDRIKTEGQAVGKRRIFKSSELKEQKFMKIIRLGQQNCIIFQNSQGPEYFLVGSLENTVNRGKRSSISTRFSKRIQVIAYMALNYINIQYLFDKIQTIQSMLPQYRMIRDFDLYESTYEELTKFSAPVFHKDDFLKDTQDNQIETNNMVSKTRSIKTKTLSDQTSFENTFIEQHVLAYKKIFQKFMETCYPHLKKSQGKSLTSEVFEIDQETATGELKLKNLIIKDNKFFEQQEKKTFMTDLFYEQKLNEFLSAICGLTHSSLAMELIFVANLFWQAYIPKQEFGMSQDQITKFMEGLLETENLEKYLEKIEFLNFSQAIMSPEISQVEIHTALKEFLKKFGVTVLLVIEEYFINVFSKDEDGYGCMKRSLNFRDISNDEFSDDEDEITFCFGHKKINF